MKKSLFERKGFFLSIVLYYGVLQLFSAVWFWILLFIVLLSYITYRLIIYFKNNTFMRKSLLTSLLMLMALFGMAQETTKLPITLTKADGLPGLKLVQNYSYKSQVYNLEEETSVLRFTVCSTNNTDKIAENSGVNLYVFSTENFGFFNYYILDLVKIQ